MGNLGRALSGAWMAGSGDARPVQKELVTVSSSSVVRGDWGTAAAEMEMEDWESDSEEDRKRPQREPRSPRRSFEDRVAAARRAAGKAPADEAWKACVRMLVSKWHQKLVPEFLCPEA